ncbi:MAG: glycosyltransferase [Verrucomicrobia bacterium]|nr:glycosyltransferase [Verrucomicrobiota bacterium]
MKTALVYDWLVTMAGGEKALAAIAEHYPGPLFTLVKNGKAIQGTLFENREIHTSFLQKLPFSDKYYRYLLPLFSLAIEQFDLSSYDLILSTSHAVAKGVLTHPDQIHLCYCLTPMRYAWDLTHQYLSTLGPLQKLAAKYTLHRLRSWDVATVGRVDHFAAISHTIARRIQKIYGRPSTVIYPPVDTDKIPFSAEKEEYYVAMSRMVPYKRIDLIAEAFSQMPERKLLIIGDGPEMHKVKSKAGKNVEILGYLPDDQALSYLKKAKGFIFAAEEDFGIVVVEAQAAGTPVLAFGKGGALETVEVGKTGLFFEEQTVASLCGALAEFEKIDFDPHAIRKRAERFSKERFVAEFHAFVAEKTQREIHA